MEQEKLKKCIDCGYMLPLRVFILEEGSVDGYTAKCKTCLSFKKCSNCMIQKPLTGFKEDPNSIDGYSKECKTCSSYNKTGLSSPLIRDISLLISNFREKGLNDAEIGQALKDQLSEGGRLYDSLNSAIKRPNSDKIENSSDKDKKQ